MTNVPLTSDADPNNPRTALAHTMVGLPFQGKSMPIAVQPSQLYEWSEYMWERGARWHPELQKVKLASSVKDLDNWLLGSIAEWVPIDQELPAEVTAPDISHLTAEEKRVLLERLEEEFKTETVEHNYAEVVR